MKRALSIIVLLVAAAITVSCSKSGPRTELHIYNWADYINPDIVKKFEKENNCTVIMDFFDSNEAMYAKLRAGAIGYDLVLPSSYMAEVMQQQGMLRPIDKSLIPNISKVDQAMIRTKTDAVMNYSVPYMMSFTGVGYNISKLDKPGSWNIFENPTVARRITLLNDMRETIGAALKYLGYSYNTVNAAELAKAEALLMKWKKNIAKLDVDEAKRGLDSGEFYAVHQYSGDIMQLMQENPTIGFFFPAEGTSFASDDFVILKNAPQPELAHRFINFCLDPANCAENMEFVFYLSPNAEALKLLPESVKSNPAFMPSAEIMAKSEMIRDLGEKNRLYSRIWDRFVSGQ